MKASQTTTQQDRWQDWFNIALGVWLVLAPFVGIGVSNDLAAWNSYIAGAVVAIFAVAVIARPQLWEEWVNLAVGVWLIVAPFVLGYTDEAGPMWNHIIVGLLIGIDALWAALQFRPRHERHA